MRIYGGGQKMGSSTALSWGFFYFAKFFFYKQMNIYKYILYINI